MPDVDAKIVNGSVVVNMLPLKVSLIFGDLYGRYYLGSLH